MTCVSRANKAQHMEVDILRPIRLKNKKPFNAHRFNASRTPSVTSPNRARSGLAATEMSPLPEKWRSWARNATTIGAARLADMLEKCPASRERRYKAAAFIPDRQSWSRRRVSTMWPSLAFNRVVLSGRFLNTGPETSFSRKRAPGTPRCPGKRTRPGASCSGATPPGSPRTPQHGNLFQNLSRHPDLAKRVRRV